MIKDEDDFAPENMDADFFDEGADEGAQDFLEGVNLDELDISQALDTATSEVEQQKTARKAAVKKKASKKRKKTNSVKKQLGIRPPKQSKFSTRAHDFFGDSQTDRALHVVLNHRETKIYLDGADICPRVLMGIPAFGRSCKKNAFEHLIAVQEKLKGARGENPRNAPEWIIISNDTSIILDRNLLPSLAELKPTTHVAGAYGFEDIRPSGKWYQVDAADQPFTRGCYIQGDLNNTNWDFIVGSKFKESPRYRISIVHRPFIAVRGEHFMQYDFTDASENMSKGFFHYMAQISLECIKRGGMVAQIKTICGQYENIHDNKSDPDFINDQSYFASTWQSLLPYSINPRKYG
jgi:hypothetical protein